jgi:hypothetical protein
MGDDRVAPLPPTRYVHMYVASALDLYAYYVYHMKISITPASHTLTDAGAQSSAPAYFNRLSLS